MRPKAVVPRTLPRTLQTLEIGRSMQRILYLTHTEADGSLCKAALEPLTSALELRQQQPGASLRIGLWGGKIQTAADMLAGCGAEEILGVAGEEFAASRCGSDAAAAEALVRAADATLVIAPATSRLCRTLPGVALRVGGRIDSHVVGIAVAGDDVHIQRWYYRQRLLATMTRSHRPWIVLVDAGVFAAWHGEAGSAAVKSVDVDVPVSCGRTQVVGIEAAKAQAQTIRPDAELLFVTGAGWTKKQADGQTHAKEAEQLILGFLDSTQASLGGSKSMVEQSAEGEDVLSFMSHLNQVGQTGSTPRHAKGLATCCHGEEPHVVGWRFIHERRAINLDSSCGWALGKADVLYVADAFALTAKMNELLHE
jgi:electron transfer flavoprotein alpha subunit